MFGQFWQRSFLSILVGATALACTRQDSASQILAPPHFEMEMSGEQYADLIKANPALFSAVNVKDDVAALKPVSDLGKRNLDFLKFINEHRSEAQRISLTSKETESAFPIEQPREYNVSIVMKMYNDLINEMPAALKSILLGSDSFPENPPLTDEDYKTWGRKADRIYQIGTRWLLMKPYLVYYERARKNDLRGYYFLTREADLSAELAGWSQLPPEKRTTLRAWAIDMCFNSEEKAVCENTFDKATQKSGALQGFIDKYQRLSKAQWEKYFVMQWSRSDIVWSSAHPEALHVPFVDPNDSGVTNYLRDNIEDEWKWTGWNLRLDFQSGSEEKMSHLRFEEGVTPHVEVPGTIVMDKNQPTTEYDSQWAIRHEFGHILGFPDCYIEFYDKDKAEMVSYQLDITNLMCSRRGHFQETHFNELKRVYFR